MIQFHVYPGGKKRVLTFSYDDGAPQDERLVDLFNRYGMKATFHLNGGVLAGCSEEKKEELRRLYAGHEIAAHTLQHGWPTRMPPASLTMEVMKDREILEDIFKVPVLGMSYPCSDYDEGVMEVMRSCGIRYSRTTAANGNFELPRDFLAWHPTCHHKNAPELVDFFLENLDSEWKRPLFYIWGHSHEFKTEDDWRQMEEVLQKLSGNDKIWYASNMDYYRYVRAQEQLEITADECCFYNPSVLDVWIEKDKKEIICIPAGKTVRL